MKIPVTLLLALIGTLGKSDINFTRHSVGCVIQQTFGFLLLRKQIKLIDP